ncbi:DEAD/DEAH box helicase [Kribbella sp. NPDC051718]|uniref:DEAD/DEAH box helicase n=1 Tax=Kribbella sp. NPDC051718 TaxID=3155168 RepID=UPI00343AE193
MVPIYGELAADGRDIVLVAGGGPAEDVAYAAKLLQQLTPLVSKSDPPGGLTLAATWPAVIQLAHIFGDRWRPQPALQAWATQQMLARTTPYANQYKLPEGLTPYPWQLEGAAMIAATGKALITDEPGTGKTITAILGLVERLARYFNNEIDNAPEPILVVCPASVVDAWVAAFRLWAPFWRTAAWRGAPRQREALMGQADVYVTSYGTARVDAKGGNRPGPLERLKPQSVVIDECHLIKNHDAQQSKAVRRLARKATCVVNLSGTPITHHSGDLWPALEAMEPLAWPAKGRYAERYLLTVPGDYDETVLGLSPYTEPEFRLCLLGQTRRVAKTDVLKHLPPKVYSVRTVELPTVWRKVYDDFEEKMLAELPDGEELSVMSMLSQLAHLSALASAPADVEYTEGPEIDEYGQLKQHVHLELKGPSWKVEALLEILAERPGQPVLAFAPSRQLMMLAGAAAAKAGLRVGHIVGGQTPKARTAVIDAFQAGQLDLICATTQAGGVGITLTAASTVVFLQRPWSLVDSIQAEDRAHRIGSEVHESIEVIDVVAANTVDTRIRAVLREKAGQLAELVQDPRIVAEILGGSTPAQVRVAKQAAEILGLQKAS